MSFSTIVGTSLGDLCWEIASAFNERGIGVHTAYWSSWWWYGLMNSRPITAHEKVTYKFTRPTQNIQTHQLYKQWQAAIEEWISADKNLKDYYGNDIDWYFPRWINHASGPLNPAEDDFLFYTLETFAGVAGLTYPGLWRRKVDRDDAFSYGQMQEGDIIGSWIIEDLQAALNAMRWYRSSEWRTIEVAEFIGSIPCVRIGTGYTREIAEADYDASVWHDSWTHPETEAYSYDVPYTFPWGRELERTSCMITARVYADTQTSGPASDSGNGIIYYKGDASAKGTFNAFGDPEIVEGVGTGQLRAVKEFAYPAGLTSIGDYKVIISMPDLRPDWLLNSYTGYSIPTQYTPLNAYAGTIRHVQGLFKPDYSYTLP